MHDEWKARVKMIKFYTLFQAKTARKPYPLGPNIKGRNPPVPRAPERDGKRFY